MPTSHYRKILILIGVVISAIVAIVQWSLYASCATWFCGLYFAYPLAVFVSPLMTNIPQSIPVIVVAQTVVIVVILYLLGWVIDRRRS